MRMSKECQHLTTRYQLGNTYCSRCGAWLHAGRDSVEVSVPSPTPDQKVAALTADNERLREIVNINHKIRAYVAFVLAGDENADVQLAADKAKAENERLRGALQRIAELDYSNAAVNCAAYDATQIAREALSAKEGR